MAYEMVMPYHLHMPSYFLETFTEYPYSNVEGGTGILGGNQHSETTITLNNPSKK